MTDTETVMPLPCPFCGNDGSGPIEDALNISYSEHDWRADSWTVQCDRCTATQGLYGSEDEAVAAWNTRTTPDNALLEEAREALQEARDALHFHYVEWDGEPEDAVPLQLARAKCDATLAKLARP